tara:strand:+ start:3882 stop:4202 length:321 start_codon:yes stop_codon:yes gene_type:complete
MKKNYGNFSLKFILLLNEILFKQNTKLNMEIINVNCGYWTGSNTITALVEENKKNVVKTKLCKFLNISEDTCNEYSMFDEKISQKNINKRQKLNFNKEIDLNRKDL